MAILAAMQSAALRLMGQRPTVFFGSQNKFEMEIADLVNEVATDIMKSNDWQKLTKVLTLIGDGTSSTFALPLEYDRMLVVSDLQDSANWLWGYTHVVDLNEFLALEGRDFQLTPGAWTLYGGEIHVTPTPADQATAIFPYISNRYAVSSGGVAKATFDNDADIFQLPERLLTLGLVWRWRENKKLDFTGDQEAFTKALEEYAAKDKGSRVYRRRSMRTIPGTHLAWPWALG